jgi:sulfite oxidase
VRSKNLIEKTPFPFCAETNPLFYDEFLTPNEEFFVRNHSLVPTKIPLDEYELVLSSGDKEIKMYTYDELTTKFKPHTVIAFLACTGNRRRELLNVFPDIKGMPWDFGASGNAFFKGAMLKDILIDSGFDPK